MRQLAAPRHRPRAIPGRNSFAGYNEAQQDVYDRIERGIEEIMTERAQRENATAASPQVVHEPFDSDATS